MERKTPEEVARDKLAEINAGKEAKKKAEESEAAKAKALEDSTKNKDQETPEQKAQKEKENTERILETPDDKLSEDEKKQKQDLVDKDRESKKQDKINRRIGELSGKIKNLESTGADKNGEIEKLTDEVDELKKSSKPKEEEDYATLSKKAEKDRLTKYIEDDKTKELSERREMDKQELEDWLDADPTEAQSWIADRNARRRDERQGFEKNYNMKKAVNKLLDSQEASAKKTYAKHPELDVKDRENELRAQFQKEVIGDPKDTEVIKKVNAKIHDTLIKENEKYRICNEVLKEHPEFLYDETAPEKIVTEMEKKLKPSEKKTDDGKKVFDSEEDFNEAVEEEIERRKAVDETVESTRDKKEEKATEEKTDLDKKQEEIAARSGISPQRLKELKDRRSKIPGASQY